MSDVDFRATALRYGSLGVATTALATVVAVVTESPLLLLGMILVGIPLFVIPGIVGVTEAGIETAAASTRIGFSAGDPGQYDPGRVLPIPNPLQAVCWLCGVGASGVVLLAAVA